jgi:hypothetical protein
VVSAAALVAAATIRVQDFWGDAATYHAMAWSLATDHDVRYEPQDIYRIRREFPRGPQGLFLKRAQGGLTPDGPGLLRRVTAEDQRLYYAKPFLYPLCAAPLVLLFGTRGLFALNALSFVVALVAGYRACRRDRSPGASLVLVLAMGLGTVMPLYLIWLTPEMFYFGLAALALALWRLDRPYVAAALVGLAAYAKPPNIFLAIPILMAPLVAGDVPIRRRLLESIRRGLALSAATLLFFAWNVAWTGEWNYQAGERKTFFGPFPYEVQDEGKVTARKVTFGNSGIWMTTNTLGPMAEKDEVAPAPREEPPRPASELRASFRRNLYYFWIGRFGGVLAYFLPVLVACLAFVWPGGRGHTAAMSVLGTGAAWASGVLLIPDSWYGGGHVVNLLLLACYVVPVLVAAAAWSTARPDEASGALALAALLAAFVFYIWFIPDDWYGNGNLGNRYFTTLVPLALFFVPRARERWIAAAAVLGAVVFLRPLFVAPRYHAFRSSAVHATRASYRWLPLELTMLNDLAIFSELGEGGGRWRMKQAYGDTGDEHKHWPAEPAAYYLYFPDNGTFGRESRPEGDGFSLRGGEDAEVILRAFDRKPIRRIRIAVTGGPAGDDVQVTAEGRTEHLTLAGGQTVETVFEAGRGFAYKETFLYPLRFHSSRGGPDEQARTVGSFVRITLDVDKTPRR